MSTDNLYQWWCSKCKGPMRDGKCFYASKNEGKCEETDDLRQFRGLYDLVTAPK